MRVRDRALTEPGSSAVETHDVESRRGNRGEIWWCVAVDVGDERLRIHCRCSRLLFCHPERSEGSASRWRSKAGHFFLASRTLFACAPAPRAGRRSRSFVATLRRMTRRPSLSTHELRQGNSILFRISVVRDAIRGGVVATRRIALRDWQPDHAITLGWRPYACRTSRRSLLPRNRTFVSCLVTQVWS